MNPEYFSACDSRWCGVCADRWAGKGDGWGGVWRQVSSKTLGKVVLGLNFSRKGVRVGSREAPPPPIYISDVWKVL